MIIKILSSTGTFNAVRYNTNKVDSGDGELMKVGNIRHCENDLNISPEEVKDYMIAFSKVNERKKNTQFHATISANGRELDKHLLTEIAEKYLNKMGYIDTPYIIVFHKDTNNNHVHIVSTRVGVDGKSISDSNEIYRTNSIRKELMQEYGISIEKDVDQFLEYNFESENQLISLLKKEGFTLGKSNDQINIYYGGDLKRTLNKNEIKYSQLDKSRAKQIKALIVKYSQEYNSSLSPVYQKLKSDQLGDVVAYRSDLTDYLKSKFGLEFHFHYSENKKPFGYSVFDHSKKNVFKGSDILKLNLLINHQPKSIEKENQYKKDKLIQKVLSFNIGTLNQLQVLAKYYKIPEYHLTVNDIKLTEHERNYYQVLLDYHFKNGGWDDIRKLGITPIKSNDELMLIDNSSLRIINSSDYLSSDIIRSYSQYAFDNSNSNNQNKDLGIQWGWDIADDVDDEKVYGRERNKDKGRGR